MTEQPDSDRENADDTKGGRARIGWLVAAAILGLLMAFPAVPYFLVFLTAGHLLNVMRALGVAALLVFPLLLVVGFFWRPLFKRCKQSTLLSTWLGFLFVHGGFAVTLTSCAFYYAGGCNPPSYLEAFFWPLNGVRG